MHTHDRHFLLGALAVVALTTVVGSYASASLLAHTGYNPNYIVDPSETGQAVRGRSNGYDPNLAAQHSINPVGPGTEMRYRDVAPASGTDLALPSTRIGTDGHLYYNRLFHPSATTPLSSLDMLFRQEQQMRYELERAALLQFDDPPNSAVDDIMELCDSLFSRLSARYARCMGEGLNGTSYYVTPGQRYE